MAAMAAGLTCVPGSEPPDGPSDRGVTGEEVKNPRAIWGAAGVVGVQEQHGGPAVVVPALDLGQGAQALPGEPPGHQRQERRDGGVVGELVEEVCRNRSMVSAPKTPVTGLSLQAHSTGRFRLLGRGGWMPAEVWQYNTAPRIARISHLRLEANGV